MRHSYRIYCFGLVAVLLAACGAKDKRAVTLDGEIKGLGTDTLYLYGADKMYSHIDTLFVSDDRFSAKLTTDTLVSTWLLFSDGTQYPLYFDKGEHIQIAGDTAALQQLDIKGNSHNTLLSTFLKEQENANRSLEEIQSEVKTFIQANPASLAGIYLLDRYLVKQPAPDYKQIEELVDLMSGELKDRPYVDELQDNIRQEEDASIGKAIPFFQLPNVEGKKITRTTTFRSKYLLIHFWASWDSLSRKKNAMYRRIYRKERKNEGAALLGVSLDIDRGRWRQTVKADTLEWEQVCDLNGWNTEIVSKLAIRTLPANVLINPSGRIEAKNLTEADIEKKFAEIKEREQKKKKKK